MDRHVTVRKPSRSDEVVDEDEQLRIANQVKALFDAQAPKRLPKPNRSEPDSLTPTSTLVQDFPIPQLDNLRSLQSQVLCFSSNYYFQFFMFIFYILLPHTYYFTFSDQGGCIFSGSNCSEQEEFVETQYYNELVSIDKQHHTVLYSFSFFNTWANTFFFFVTNVNIVNSTPSVQ